jgi:hypothetical protein
MELFAIEVLTAASMYIFTQESVSRFNEMILEDRGIEYRVQEDLRK